MIAAVRARLFVVVHRQLPDRARHSDGHLAAGIHVPEQNIGHGRAAFLSQIPTLEHGVRPGDDIRNREGLSIDEHDDDWLSECEHRIDQFLLLADQIERCAIAQMSLRPRFAKHCAAAADDDNDRVRILRDLHSLLDTLAILCGVCKL